MDVKDRPAPLITAGMILAQSGAYGLVWLNPEFDVTAKYGSLVADVKIGTPLTETIPALFGYESDISALAGNPGKLFVLPGIKMPAKAHDEASKNTPRLNITAFWSQTDNQFIILIARTATVSQTDLEVSQQMRKRLMAEEALAQKSRELELANRDLEEYAEIIAHDLSAPLRAIRYLADDIETALVSCDRSSMENSITDLRVQSKRMSSMMKALLDYASLSRKTQFLEIVETRELTEQIIKSLPHREGLSIQIEGNWPTIKTMKAPLDLVIRNLIDNAIKHHDKTSGTITIKSNNSRASNHLKFTVRDDGPGIDPKNHGAIMLPFRSLNTSPTTPSHGMGLALVKRTLETAGGSLTLESNPAQSRGTAITFTWPLNEEICGTTNP